MRLAVVVLSMLVSGVATYAQSDLDALMARVLARRDANWAKLQQYVLNERETLQATGPADTPFYGFRREYLWFPRDGHFVRSPVTADGVTVSEAARVRAEKAWIAAQQRRARRRGTPEPGFITAAYFLNFTFDPGHYALVGRETFDGREVLRIEYYPTRMFTRGQTRPNRRLRERDPDVERKLNKVSTVTLWVLPEEHQIVKYEADQIDPDFLPAQPLLRFDTATADMEMSQAFPGIWLPRRLRIGLELVSAAGRMQAEYSAEYSDYRLADVKTRIR